jgi:Gill-associated viral 3C-like peptidase
MTTPRTVQTRPAHERVSRGGRVSALGLRLIWLYAGSRRVPVSLAGLAVCGIGLRIALIGHWDAYGALQLPLISEATAAAIVTATTASPLGEPERVTGRWLPWLRLGAAAGMTAAAIGALAVGAVGGHLAGGVLDVLRNVAGLVGIGLLCAAVVGGGLAWVGPTAYIVAGVYALYTQWHPPAMTTPWLWPARPPHDLGAAICAGVVFVCGLAVTTVRGARDAPGQ